MKKIKKYDFIFSLGAACSGSYALRKRNFQIYSLPFDWLMGSDFLSRINLIKNHFSNWFNIEDFELVDKRFSPEPRNIYKNKKTDITYSHDFPLNEDLDKNFIEIKEKYERRIKRLYNSINKSKKILVLYILNPWTKEVVSDETLIRGQKILSEIFENKEIDILFLELNGETKEVNGNIRKIGYFETKEDEFRVSLKEVDKILKENIKCSHSIIDYINLLFRIRKIKKGILINFLVRISTIFRIKIYLLGLRFVFCVGKEREYL